MSQRFAELSEQQKRCLRLVHQGLTSKEIAPRLATTPGVIDNYIQVAVQKLGALNRRDAARLLATSENPMVQQLHLQPSSLAEPDETAIVDLSAPLPPTAEPPANTAGVDHPGSRWMRVWIWLLDLIGGPPHDLNRAETVRSILWTALATTGVLACIITISAWLNYKAN